MNRKYRRFCFLHRTATAYPWGELQELLFVDGTSDMPERIPVYSDPYPSDHGDPEYEFTEVVKGNPEPDGISGYPLWEAWKKGIRNRAISFTWNTKKNWTNKAAGRANMMSPIKKTDKARQCFPRPYRALWRFPTGLFPSSPR